MRSCCPSSDARRPARVHGPLGEPVDAEWGLRGDTAVIEMARASGLALVAGRNDPLRATTFGTGELLRAALDSGVRRAIVAVGGSATVDGGLGALEALDFDLRGADVVVACDVTTPFAEAARVFGPQKGAGAAAVAELERRLGRLADRYRDARGVDVRDLPGAGAAGGLAGGLAAYGARLVPGAALVADVVGLRDAVRATSLVLTGEGRVDATSFAGKVVGHVLGEARALGVPVAIVAGDAERGALPKNVECLTLVELGGSLGPRSGTPDASPPTRRRHSPAPTESRLAPAGSCGNRTVRASLGRQARCTTSNRTGDPHATTHRRRDTLRTAASSDVLVFPTDAGWDDARRAWNLAVDQRPAVVALPGASTTSSTQWTTPARSGSGSPSRARDTARRGTPLDGTMLVNTSRMTGVEVDPKGRTARVAAGTIWGDVVDAAVPHGLTALHGSAPDVGVVGYSLGGGIGWLARKHGLSSSSVLSAEVVTADGEVSTPTPRRTPICSGRCAEAAAASGS